MFFILLGAIAGLDLMIMGCGLMFAALALYPE